MARSDLVTKRDVTNTLKWLGCAVNKEVGEQTAEAEKKNSELVHQLSEGIITAKDFCAKWTQPPTQVKAKQWRHVCKKFLKKTNYTKQTTNTSGNYLAFDDAKMKQFLGMQALTFHMAQLAE